MPVDQPLARPESRSGKWLVIVLVACALALGLAAGWFMRR